MVTKNGLMRIFWPSDAAIGTSPGVLVGFRNSELDVMVVSILQDVEVSLSGYPEELGRTVIGLTLCSSGTLKML